MKTIYFVRHGESVANIERKVQTDSEPLTDLGLSQATAVADRMKSLEFEVLYSSPLDRARGTAEAVAAATGHEIIFDSRLHEVPWREEYWGLPLDDPRIIALQEGAEHLNEELYDKIVSERFEDMCDRARVSRSRTRWLCGNSHGRYSCSVFELLSHFHPYERGANQARLV